MVSITAADFIGDRFYCSGLRGFSACVTLFISFCYCVGQFAGIGIMFEWILGFDYTLSIIIGATIVLTYTLLSGMLGVTKNMQVQYVIIIVSFMLPLFVLAYKFGYFCYIPQFGYGEVVSDIVNGVDVSKGVNA